MFRSTRETASGIQQALVGMEHTAQQLHELPTRLYLLCGHSYAYTAALVLGSATQQHLALIDGAMRFNSYTLSNVARTIGIPAKPLLQRTHVTRSFTAFQTEAAITEKLPRFLTTRKCPIVIILGLLDTFYDEQVKPHECRQSLLRILQTLKELTRKRIHVLIADVEVGSPPDGKKDLFRLVQNAVDVVTVLEYHNNQIRLTEQRRTPPWDATTTRSRLSSSATATSGASSDAG